MNNSRGQILVIFIILLPLLFLLAAFVIDNSYILYQKNKLDNINVIVSDYVKTNPKVNVDEIGELIRQNDREVMIKKINFNENIEINLEKEVKSIFGKLIGKNSYLVKSDIIKEIPILDNYITEGLIIHLDGYDEPVGNVWKDRSINKNDVVIENFDKDKGSYYDSKTKGYVFNTIGIPSTRGVSLKELGISGNNEFTVEVVFSPHAYNKDMISGLLHFGDSPLTGTGKTFSITFDEKADKVIITFTNVHFTNLGSGYKFDSLQSVSFAHETGNMTMNQNTGQSLVIDGEVQPYKATASATINLTNSKLYVGQAGVFNNQFRGFIGTIHSIRIYNRQLSVDEQMKNYEIDKNRFTE